MNDSDSPNFAEYAVEKKTEGKVSLYRFLLILGYTLFGTGYFAVCFKLAFIPLVAVLPLFLWIIIFFTWRYVSYDEAYTFTAGTMVFSRIYARKSKRIRRELLSVRVKDASFAGPWDSSRREDELRRVTKIYDYASSKDSADAAFLVFTDEGGRECAVRFDCINRVAGLLRSFCPKAEFGAKQFRY